MKKTLYSLMLSDDVIREIDILAHRLGMNRSSLVNQILAEHVKLRTPEQRIGDIFSEIETLMSSSRELVPILTQGSPSIALRSCLAYKYRPTIRYEVALAHNVEDGRFGELSVIFRTTSTSLLELLDSFFRIWVRIENSLLDYPRSYALADGRFTRSLTLPSGVTDSRALAEAISTYVSLLDSLIKGSVAGNLTAESLAELYANAYNRGEIII